jgi:capsular polysaccharide transport system permease protein
MSAHQPSPVTSISPNSPEVQRPHNAPIRGLSETPHASEDEVNSSSMGKTFSLPPNIPNRHSIFVRSLAWFSRNLLLLLTVILPTSLASVYFALLAPDIYISEAHFVIRSPQAKTPTGLGALIQGNSITRSHDDTHTVHDFIQSRDALRMLMDRLPILKAFSIQEPFPLHGFPNLFGDQSFDALHRYYQKKVSVSVDSQSGISVLAVRAFRPDDASQINETLLELSEKLINDLNSRARKDMIQFASSEVAQAEKRAKTASLALSAYRNAKQVFDPERQSGLQFQQIARLQDELILSKSQLSLLEDSSNQSPMLRGLKKRIEILAGEISSETAKIVGADASLANKAAEYEHLALDKSFAEKSLAAALASLETARNEALRKQLYLERIVNTNLPDRSFEPRRIRRTLEVFFLGIVAWGIGSMLIAGIREHQE